MKKNKDKQSAFLASEIYYTNGPTINRQKLNRLNFFGKYNLTLSPASQLSATVSSFTSKWNASGQIPERAVESGLIDRFGSLDPSEGGNTHRHNATINVNHRFQNGFQWENAAYYSRNLFGLYSNFTFFLNDSTNGDEIKQAEKRNVIGYSSKLSKHYFFTGGSLQSVYGAGIRYDAVKNNELSTAVKRQFLNYTKLGDIKETNSFAFIQQQLNKGRWLVEGGLRLDYLHFGYFDKLSTNQLPSQGKGILSPKINIQYALTKKAQVYFKTGKGFHSNDTRVVIAQAGHEILPAAYGADAGVVLKPTNQLFISAAVWWLYLDQEFVYVGDDGNIEPSGKTTRKGIDLLIRYQFSSALFANIDVNLTKPRANDAPKGENYIPLAPLARSTGGLFYKTKTGLNGGFSYRYIKSRPANEGNSITAKGYFLLDGAVNYTLNKYEVGLAVENILNVNWNEAQFATESRLKNEPPPITELNFKPGMPLLARLKLAYNF